MKALSDIPIEYIYVGMKVKTKAGEWFGYPCNGTVVYKRDSWIVIDGIYKAIRVFHHSDRETLFIYFSEV